MVSSFLRPPMGSVDIWVDAASRSRLPSSQKWILEKWILGLYSFRCSGSRSCFCLRRMERKAPFCRYIFKITIVQSLKLSMLPLLFPPYSVTICCIKTNFGELRRQPQKTVSLYSGRHSSDRYALPYHTLQSHA